MKVRRKLLNQKISLKFSQSGKRKPLHKLICEFKDVILSNSCAVNSSTTSVLADNPLSLVGRHISHKFICEDTREEVWYEGYIVEYNMITKMHELAYIEEDDNCHFDLTEDLRNRDIIFLDDD